ncbi:serine protease inhibitor 77Ba-like [Danaus plexippus]|uniref:serine protease inhibitor 77Ba-like n=1 Tax=Danaus plexippus TaxID=13037 RepID=UPI002AB25AC8|nr:serine protease inhibitor 77Ba-like [Danaus plexippus]
MSSLRRNLLQLLVLCRLLDIFSPALCKTKNVIPYTDLRSFGEKVRNLSFHLFNYTEQRNDCGLLAPYTLWNLVSLVAFMTSEDSWNQLHKTMGVSRRKGKYFNSIYNHINDLMTTIKPGASFKINNTVFYDSRLQLTSNFEDSIMASGVSLKKLNFDDNVLASDSANNYIQSNYFLIPKRIIFHPSDFKDTSMIVSGVVEFEAAWAKPFDISLSDRFVMRQTGEFFYTDVEWLHASVLELSYASDFDFSMLVIRPRYGVALKDVITNLALKKLDDIFQKLYTEGSKETVIELPKFSLTSLQVLNEPFMSMGIINVFLPDEADFSGISSDNLYIQSFEQRVTVTVSETGTTAAAYTPANVAKSTSPNEIGSASPFIFLIVHGPSLSIVFCGKYGE